MIARTRILSVLLFLTAFARVSYSLDAHGNVPISSKYIEIPDSVIEKLQGQINKVDDKGNHLIHRAVQEGLIDVVEGLLDLGVDPDSKNRDGETPLFLAARTGNAKLARILLEAGADVDARTAEGLTPLHVAASAGHAEVVTLLLDAGADLEAVDGKGRTPLNVAVFRPEALKALLARGANTEARCSRGYTVLHKAARWGPEQSVLLLLAAGADKTALDREGHIPLFWAVKRRSKDLLELLTGSEEYGPGSLGLKDVSTRVLDTSFML